MYERFFGLADAPFRLTPDPRYLFLSRKHAEALAHLKLGLRESSGFVCITGDVGTGKTTLVRAFLADLGPEVATAYVFNPALSALELLQTINSELGLAASSTSRKALTDALNAHLLAQREAGRRSIVVIDEAQALSIDVLEQLRLLSNLETTTEKLLRIVLVGQPQLRGLLTHPELTQLNQRITLRWHMGPLSYPETVAYVRHRLRVAAGGPPPRVFTREAIRLVHRISRGVPRLINMVAHRALLAGFADDRHVVSRRLVRQAYREIGALPLALPVSSAPRRAAWAAAGIGACLGVVALGVVALGVERLGWRPDLVLPGIAESLAPSAASVADPPAAAPAETPVPVAAPPPVELPGPPEPSAAVPGATPSEPTPAAPEPVAAPPAGEVAAAPAAEVAAAPPAEPAPAPPAVDVAHRLAELDARASARAAVDALLAAWRVGSLAPEEPASPAALAGIAQRRGLEHLPLVGNVSMLRLLDLPAIIVLRVPSTDGQRYAALTDVQDGKATLVVDGAATPVDRAFLERHWFGEAHVLWRDFEALGPSFGREGRGGPVARLQGLLRGVGAYRGAVNGLFDSATEAAVLDFQRSRFLTADGRVGRLTRIVLYAAVGGYPRPTLGAAS